MKLSAATTAANRLYLKRNPTAHGSSFRNFRQGRGARPLSTNQTMHMILRSSKAKGEWAFSTHINEQYVDYYVSKFARKYGVRILSLVNVHNHLHFHIQLTNRLHYKHFIRALTAALAMAITKKSRWNKLKEKFWDYRPFTRIIANERQRLSLRDYLAINELEGRGIPKDVARVLWKWKPG